LKIDSTRQECWKRVKKKGVLSGVERSRVREQRAHKRVNEQALRGYRKDERARDLHGEMRAQEQWLQKKGGERVRSQAKRGKRTAKIGE
jgi:hypothetical protein